MGGILSTHVEMNLLYSLACVEFFEIHFVSSLALDGVWSIKNELYFVSSLELERFGQHDLKYILCTRWHGISLINAK